MSTGATFVAVTFGACVALAGYITWLAWRRDKGAKQ